MNPRHSPDFKSIFISGTKVPCTCTWSIFFRYKVQYKQNSQKIFRYKNSFVFLGQVQVFLNFSRHFCGKIFIKNAFFRIKNQSWLVCSFFKSKSCLKCHKSSDFVSKNNVITENLYLVVLDRFPRYKSTNKYKSTCTSTSTTLVHVWSEACCGLVIC